MVAGRAHPDGRVTNSPRRVTKDPRRAKIPRRYRTGAAQYTERLCADSPRIWEIRITVGTRAGGQLGATGQLPKAKFYMFCKIRRTPVTGRERTRTSTSSMGCTAGQLGATGQLPKANFCTFCKIRHKPTTGRERNEAPTPSVSGLVMTSTESPTPEDASSPPYHAQTPATRYSSVKGI